VIRTTACALLFAYLCCACSGHRHAAVADAARRPLQPCETRVVTIDGTRMLVIANADGTPATMAPASGDAGARERALRDAAALFGAPRRDVDAVARSSKFGPVTYTDRCGRPLPPPETPVR
jgi:hypothetical protein